MSKSSVFIYLRDISVAVICVFVVYKLVCSVFLGELADKVCGRICGIAVCVLIIGKEYTVAVVTDCFNLGCPAEIICCGFCSDAVITYI